MAQDHRQSQAQQLLDKQPVFEISLQLAQLAPVAEHQEDPKSTVASSVPFCIFRLFIRKPA